MTWCLIYGLQLHHLVFLAAKTYFLCMIYGMNAMTAGDTLNERLVIITWLALVVEHHVNACLVKGYRVK